MSSWHTCGACRGSIAGGRQQRLGHAQLRRWVVDIHRQGGLEAGAGVVGGAQSQTDRTGLQQRVQAAVLQLAGPCVRLQITTTAESPDNTGLRRASVNS